VVGVLVELAADGVGAGLRDPRARDLLLGLRQQDEGAELVEDLGSVVLGRGHWENSRHREKRDVLSHALATPSANSCKRNACVS
jgi:hypothetical protein